MFLSRYQEQTYALLRIAAGFLFLCHGSQKFFDLPPAGHPIPTHVLLIGGSVEFIGGMLIMVGLWTHWAAFFASGEMAYAYWTVHAHMGPLPMTNMGELPVLFCFVFLYFAAKGSGIFSIDAYLHRRSRL